MFSKDDIINCSQCGCELEDEIWASYYAYEWDTENILCGDGDNTNRFIYHDDGEITWEHTNQIVEDYIPVKDFATFVTKMVGENKRGVYEYVS